MEEHVNPMMTKIWQAVWARKRGLAFCAVVSLVLLVILSTAISLIVPKVTCYDQDVQIFLTKNAQNFYIYPNEQLFSPSDVISPEVLHRVYEECKLQDCIEYEDFTPLFSFANVIREKQFLDEKYAKALQRRNITGADIEKLESKYREDLANLDQGMFCLSFRKTARIPDKVAEGIPLKVLETWKKIYQVRNGRLPLNALTSTMKKELGTESVSNPLIAVDRAIYYKEQMQAFCLALKQALGTRRLILPETGETLDDILERLTYIRNCQLDILMQMVIESQSLRGVWDELFISGKIRNLEKQLAEAERKRNSIENALVQLGGGANASAGASSGKAAAGETQLNFDASFFEQLSLLIRNDIMNRQRGSLANQYNEKGLEAAQLTSELEYYTGLKKQLAVSKSQKVDKAAFTAQFQNAVDAMVQTAKQLDQFKSLILDCEISDTLFYRPSGPTCITQSSVISRATLAATVFMLWILINFCTILIACLPAFHAEKK
ncbi:MAG: hypothetical protein J5944_13305 [Lentisphaeria bacterium]|nr:hypothetical protein [Lentisphaeria bacterium]